MRDKLGLNYKLILAVLLGLFLSSASLAVSSKVTRHTSSSDLLKGRTEKVVIGSRGTIQLGRAAESTIFDCRLPNSDFKIENHKSKIANYYSPPEL